MELYNHLITWLNAEEEQTVLQRDGIYALLTWKDLNQPAEPVFTFRMAALLFIVAVGVPVLMLV